MNNQYPPIEEFSEAYFMFSEVDVEQYGGENVVVAHDFMGELGKYVCAPLVKLPTGHRWIRPEWGVPPNTLAIPEDYDGDDLPLLAKDHTVKSLLNKGVVDSP